MVHLDYSCLLKIKTDGLRGNRGIKNSNNITKEIYIINNYNNNIKINK